jgi:hypothetical protein
MKIFGGVIERAPPVFFEKNRGSVSITHDYLYLIF